MVTRAALAALLVVGIALRVALSLLYSPAVLDNPDSGRYLRSAFGPEGLFSDPFAPAGYPLFLRAARFLSGELWVTVALQHALGVVTALLLYGCVRAGGGRWLALLPAGVVLLSGDQLYLEHALLSETLFTPLVAAGAYAGVRAVEGGEQRPGPLALCGGLLGAAALTRGVGLALVPVAVGWAALAAPPAPVRRRLAAAGGVLCAAAAPVAVYVGLAAVAGGDTGLVEQNGWSLYARAAPFARCGEFTAPRGTEMLCEGSSAADRPGGSFYLWDRHHSPARRAFGFPPAGAARVGAFARAAIVGQPGDYVQEVGRDLLRVVRPDHSARPLSGGGSSTMAVERRSPRFEAEIAGAANARYAPVSVSVSPRVGLAAAYQRLTTWLTPILLVAYATIMVALVLAPRRRRRRGTPDGSLLLGGLALALVLTPIAVFQYTPRFAVPALGLWSAAGAAAASTLGSRLAARSSRRSTFARVLGARPASTP